MPHTDKLQEDAERLWQNITAFNDESKRSPAVIVISAIALLVFCILFFTFSVL